MFVATKYFLSRQSLCRNKYFVATNILSRQNTSFVATKVCFQRQNFCRYKIMFVATKYFCRDKTFVATNILSRQKTCFVARNTCLSTNVSLSQQPYFCCDRKRVLSRKTHICRDKTFVAAKMKLVAAPANDKQERYRLQ